MSPLKSTSVVVWCWCRCLVLVLVSGPVDHIVHMDKCWVALSRHLIPMTPRSPGCGAVHLSPSKNHEAVCIWGSVSILGKGYSILHTILPNWKILTCCPLAAHMTSQRPCCHSRMPAVQKIMKQNKCVGKLIHKSVFPCLEKSKKSLCLGFVHT